MQMQMQTKHTSSSVVIPTTHKERTRQWFPEFTNLSKHITISWLFHKRHREYFLFLQILYSCLADSGSLFFFFFIFAGTIGVLVTSDATDAAADLLFLGGW